MWLFSIHNDGLRIDNEWGTTSKIHFLLSIIWRSAAEVLSCFIFIVNVNLYCREGTFVLSWKDNCPVVMVTVKFRAAWLGLGTYRRGMLKTRIEIRGDKLPNTCHYLAFAEKCCVIACSLCCKMISMPNFSERCSAKCWALYTLRCCPPVQPKENISAVKPRSK